VDCILNKKSPKHTTMGMPGGADTQVAEEVAVRVETELGACKQRCVALEGAARAAQREARMLEEALRVHKGVEYDGTVKSLKAEEGGWRLLGWLQAFGSP